MEKKNTILLTVIAIATLLVAVVGATFAYFTASVTTDPKSDNTPTAITTQTLVSAVMKSGDNVSSQDALPGFKAVRSVEITGSGSENALPINTQIVLTPSIAGFEGNVKYKVYKIAAINVDEEESGVKGVTCTNQVETGTATIPAEDEGGADRTVVTHFMTPTCDYGDAVPVDANLVSGEGTFVNGQDVTIDIEVSYNTEETYYIEVEYEDTNAEQDQQGKNFKIGIRYQEVSKTTNNDVAQ